MSTSSLNDSVIPESSTTVQSSPSSPLQTSQVVVTTNQLTDVQIVESRPYKVALALNNIGIALLQRHSYRDAITIFRKASCMIRSITPFMTGIVNSSNETDEKICTRADIVAQIDDDLTLANTLLRKCQAKEDSSTENGKKSSSSRQQKQLFHFTILNDSSYDEIFDAATSYPIHKHGYVIEIDTSGDDCYTSNVLLQMAIIFLNYAVAYQCQVNVPTRKVSVAEREVKYMTLGYKLLSVAHEVLKQERKRLDHMIHSTIPNETVWYHTACADQIELVTLITVQSLMHLSFDLNKPEEGHQYYLLLGDLHLGYEKPQDDIKQGSKVIAPAA